MPRKKESASTASKTAGIHQLHVEISDIVPQVWRTLLVRSDASLGLLHAVLQVAMGWTNSHLHMFTVGDNRYSDRDFADDFGEDTPDLDETKAKLGSVAPQVGHRFVYEYDFGDSWNHIVTVEKVIEPDPSFRGVARCIAGECACPPEDCGGAWGYADLLKTIKDPDDEEYESMMAWLGGGFDPEAFDIDRTNAFLGKLKYPDTSIEQLRRILMARHSHRY